MKQKESSECEANRCDTPAEQSSQNTDDIQKKIQNTETNKTVNDSGRKRKRSKLKSRLRKRKAPTDFDEEHVTNCDDTKNPFKIKTEHSELSTNTHQSKPIIDNIEQKNQIKIELTKTDSTSCPVENTEQIDNKSKNTMIQEPTQIFKNSRQNFQNEKFNENKKSFIMEVNKNSVEKTKTINKKKFSVNDRLQKIRKELIEKQKNSPGVIRKLFPSKQFKKKFSVNERLQKIREELQTKQHTICQKVLITKLGGNLLSKLKNSECKSKNDKKQEKFTQKSELSFAIAIQPYTNKTNEYNKNSKGKKFSVNDRLKRIQEELQSKRKSLIQNSDTPEKSEKIITKTNHQEQSIEPMDISDMDWEATNDNANELNISTMSWDCINQEIKENIEEIRCKSPPIESTNKIETLSDFYDTVNNNLMRLFAQNDKITDEILIEKDKFYFVIDTNMFLKDLHFLTELIELKNCDKNKIVLIVPYVVLQELDSLKMRKSQAVSTLAVRAIKYLNDQYEMKNSNIQSQSAINAENYLITINSADDSILNCCLQIKKKTDYIALLTHDINLKNKARTCDIKCFSKDDFEEFNIVQK